MTIYGYECRECGQAYDSEYHGSVLQVIDLARGFTGGDAVFVNKECVCGHGEIKRKYSLAIHRPMMAHFNTSVGTEISSDRQFRDELKRKSEEQFLRTGIPADYVPADPAETRKAAEASGYEGLESTNRQRVRDGLKPIRV
jgi:hypothetical protein